MEVPRFPRRERSSVTWLTNGGGSTDKARGHANRAGVIRVSAAAGAGGRRHVHLSARRRAGAGGARGARDRRAVELSAGGAAERDAAPDLGAARAAQPAPGGALALLARAGALHDVAAPVDLALDQVGRR